MHVEYQGQSAKLPLIVAEVDGKPAILGRNWISAVKLNWKEPFNVSSPFNVSFQILSVNCLLSTRVFLVQAWEKSRSSKPGYLFTRRPPRSFISPNLYRTP